jgi:hypothetical protein
MTFPAVFGGGPMVPRYRPSCAAHLRGLWEDAMSQPPVSEASGVVLRQKPGEALAPLIDLGPLAERVSATPRQTCTALSIGVTKLYELLSNGELVSYHEGKARRILVSSIREYVARRLAASPRAT